MTANWTLGKKLLTGFIGVSAIGLLLGGLGYYAAMQGLQQVEELGAVRLPSVQNLLIMDRECRVLDGVMHSLARGELSLAQREELYEQAERAAADYQKAWETYAPLPQTPEEAQVWKQLVPVANAWLKASERFLDVNRDFDALGIPEPNHWLAGLQAQRSQLESLQVDLLTSLVPGQGLGESPDADSAVLRESPLTVAGDNPELRRLREEMRALGEQLAARVAPLRAAVAAGDREQAAQVYTEQVAPVADELLRRVDSVLRLIQPALDRHAGIATLLTGSVEPRMAEAVKLLDQLVAINTDVVRDEHEAAHRQMGALQVLCLVLPIIGLAASLGLGLLITRSISSAVGRLLLGVQTVATGDLDVAIDTSANDELGLLARAFQEMVDRFRGVVGQAAAIAQGDYEVQINPRSSKDELAVALGRMTQSLRQTTAANQRQDWLKTGQAILGDTLRGDLELAAICREALEFLAKYLNVQVGGIFLLEDGALRLLGSYGYQQRKNLSNEFHLGEGLVGQAALEKRRILLTNVPADYVRIASGLGECVPRNIVVVPLLAGQRVMGVLELASVASLEGPAEELLELVGESIGIAIASARSRNTTQRLLEQTQQQAEKLLVQQEELQAANEELQTQQEELRVANEELEEQTRTLKLSESQLQAQQEELRVTNEELEERTKALEEQRNSIAKKNTEINLARQELERKARDLETASKYKSEFLANMSHELRTPLNSILILSQLLSENKELNLTTKQREFARTIHTSGSDLLELINEILDLSKVESGKMELRIEELSLRELRNDLARLFEPLAREKKLDFRAEVAADLPAVILTDPQRLKQILKNLLSNAFKFTEQGRVTLTVGRPRAGTNLSASGLSPAETLAFSVCDSGIGIPLEQQRLVFEAFRQADGTASRKYGGTGLGLTISRELCKLLGGEIQLVSSPGQGTEFVVYLPAKLTPRPTPAGESALAAAVEERTEEVRSQIRESHERRAAAQAPAAAVSESGAGSAACEEAREPEQSLAPEPGDAGRKRLLIVEDDARFAQILASIAEERGFSCVLTGSGEEALAAIAHCQPGAVILDLQLPGMDGWTVLERLKASPETRHIPVHIMSVSDSGHEALKRGSIGFLPKPVSNEGIHQALERIESVISKAVGRLLLVEDDAGQRTSLCELIGAGDVAITAVATGREALAALADHPFDAMVLDLGLSDMNGFELLERISQDERIRKIPVIIYTGQDLTEAEEAELRKYAESIIVKGVRSPERLLDETALFLHRVEKDLPADKQRMLRLTRDNDAVFQDKTILVVDDDMRNVFALSSVLEYAGLNVVVGKNGRDGITKLEDNPQISLVLMDIMMPEMDGYQAMREIRQRRKYAKLPIIALTAKAMKGDRAKCIEAGANDYLAKPVDTDKLLSLLRVWLYR